MSSVQNIWDFISDHARKKYNNSIEKEVLSKIHLPSLLVNLVTKLNIKLAIDAQSIDFSKIDPATGKSCFLQDNDLQAIIPNVKDYRDHSCKEGDIHTFPISLHLVLDLARRFDKQGKKSMWYMEGDPSRAEASELYRLAIRIASSIYQHQ